MQSKPDDEEIRSNPLASGELLSHYKIIEKIGAGGMGEVYRARDTRLGRDVAIKVLSPHLAQTAEVRARFEREARTISQLNHPHICTLYDIGRQGGLDYLVMELLEGETLANRLARGPLPVPEVLSLGAQIAEALDVAHRRGIIHRDLKPGNVMLTKAGVKLMDFGLARSRVTPVAGAEAESPTISRPLTEKGTLVGTFQYMAPEQLEGKEADVRSDIWALGCVLYEMATGKPSFEGTSQASLIAAIMDHEPRPITELQPLSPPALDHLVRRCLAKDPDARWQSARDVAHELEWVRTTSGIVPAPGTKLTRPHPRHRIGVLAAGILGSALLITIGFVLGGHFHSAIDPSRLHYTRLTIQRGSIGAALFSPDGRTVFYSAAWDGNPYEVFETRPGFPTSRPLGLAETSLLSVSESGMMAVGVGPRRDTLAEVPITGGAPRRILDDVSDASWAPDGRTLAVVHWAGGKARLEMPPGHVLYETAGQISLPRVSRDGRFVAFADNPMPGDSRGTVVIIDTSGHVVARTGYYAGVSGVAWSADGGEVWYSACNDVSTGDLRAIRPDGGERVVTRWAGFISLHDVARNGQVLLVPPQFQVGIRGRGPSSEDERELGWFDWSSAEDISSDGRELLFEEEGIFGGPQYAVCLRGMDGSPPVKLGEGHAVALSPDNKWALAIYYGPPQRLILYPTGTGDSTSVAPGPIERYYAARWLPDGKSLIITGSEAGHTGRAYLQDLEGGPPRAITPEGITGVLVSPDGRLLAAVSLEQQLFMYPVAGGDARLVVQLLPNEYPIQWTSDGRALYVGGRPSSTNAQVQVDRIDVSTGQRVPWKTFKVPDPAGVSISGPFITPDGRSYAYTYNRSLDDLYLVDGLK